MEHPLNKNEEKSTQTLRNHGPIRQLVCLEKSVKSEILSPRFTKGPAYRSIPFINYRLQYSYFSLVYTATTSVVNAHKNPLKSNQLLRTQQPSYLFLYICILVPPTPNRFTISAKFKSILSC